MAKKLLTKIENEAAEAPIQQQAPAPPISQAVPKPLAKNAATTPTTMVTSVSQAIDVLRNSSNETAVHGALSYLHGPPNFSQWSPSVPLETVVSLTNALLWRIPTYSKMLQNPDGTSTPLWESDMALRNNLSESLTILGISISQFSKATGGSSGLLPQTTLVNAAEIMAPFLNGNTYAQDVKVFDNAIHVIGCIFDSLTAALPKDLSGRIFTSLLGQLEKNIETREVLVRLCTEQALYGRIPELIQDYKQFILSGAEKEGDRSLFVTALGTCTGSLTTSEYETIFEHWVANPPPHMDNSIASIKNSIDSLFQIIYLSGTIINNEDTPYRLKGEFDNTTDEYQKTILGTLVTYLIFKKPALADETQFKEMLGFGQELVTVINSQSPGRANLIESFPISYIPLIDDSFCIYEMAQKHRGDPIIKTLVEQNNITQFGIYPIDVIEHLYYDRNNTSEKPIMFMIFTKRPGYINFSNTFNTFDYKNFDIRVIEPRTDDNMVSLMHDTFSRLGKKFRHLMVHGHGYPGGVLLKTAVGISREQLDVGDVELLKQIKPLFVENPDIVLYACSTAGDNRGDANVAKIIAQNLNGRCYGAKSSTSGIERIVLNTQLEIEAITYGLAETGVYDYRSTSSQTIKAVPAIPRALMRHSGNIYTIPAAKGASGDIYDMRGRHVAKLSQDAAGNFVWNADGMPAADYIVRILEEGKMRAERINKLR